MTELTFTEYQRRARSTAVYMEPAARMVQGEDGRLLLRIMYCGNGLGEAGEIQNKIKKILRDDGGILLEERRDQILEEVGGLLWYIANLCTELDADLAAVAEINLAILAQRRLDGTISGDGDIR